MQHSWKTNEMNQHVHPADDPEFWEVLAVKLPWKRTEE